MFWSLYNLNCKVFTTDFRVPKLRFQIYRKVGIRPVRHIGYKLNKHEQGLLVLLFAYVTLNKLLPPMC